MARASPADPRPRSFDAWLAAAVLLLTAGGLVMVYSASAVKAGTELHDQFYFLKRQLVAAGLGLGLLLLGMRLGARGAEKLAYLLLGVTVLTLVLVLVPGIGRVAGGARRWINLGLFSFQPAELAKVALVLYLARSLARKQEKMKLFSIGLLPHLLVTLLLVGLCLLQRDFGTGVVLALVLFAMLFAAGAKVSYLLGAVLLAIPVAWRVIAGTPYRMQRIQAFLDPFQHKEGAGWQMVESLLGIGNGGWLGQGLGQGKGKLFYLPAAHTDFIAAVVAEEVGLVGIALLLLLYAIVAWRGFRAALRATDPFACYAALGLTVLITAQALINLSVVFVLLPTKGLTLPFVSYGGSSLITLLGAAGLLLALSGDRGGFLARSTPSRGGASAAGLRPSAEGAR
ncbi:MAG: putative lipid II flippase FtsW [Deltaproteobacteria bacterium]|nr:putative lipid II flippase FtsW [Deltaproteobacteria bacterium]